MGLKVHGFLSGKCLCEKQKRDGWATRQWDKPNTGKESGTEAGKDSAWTPKTHKKGQQAKGVPKGLRAQSCLVFCLVQVLTKQFTGDLGTNHDGFQRKAAKSLNARAPQLVSCKVWSPWCSHIGLLEWEISVKEPYFSPFLPHPSHHVRKFTDPEM